jgi:UDP-N-acetyl-2-amino-2-deoxyglucuronate dehydrogenase
MYRIGIVGYGWVATAHIAAIEASGMGRVTAVCSSRELDLDLKLYQSPDAMFADPGIDIVSICSYPQDHVDQAIAAAQAGKHLIIEKPLALNEADLDRLEAAVTAAGVRVCVCFECRFSSQFRETMAVIDAGKLGQIHYGEIDYYHGIGPWYGQYRWNTRKDAGGSSLLSAGCHAMDALLLCMGSEVTEVYAVAAQSAHADFAGYEYPTTSVTTLKFANGAIGKCASVIDCLQPYYFHTHLVGSAGALLDNRLHCDDGSGDKSWTQLPMKMLDSGDVSDHPYQAQFEAFFRALDADEDMPLTALADAVRSHRVIFAAERSILSGKPEPMR